MGSTNFTPNYNLPQFIGTDKPAWLTDVNGAFSAIDTEIKNAADAASNASSVAGSASSAATAAANTANTLDTQINTPSTGLAAVVSANTSDISTLGGLVGNTPLTTVAQTVTGAIEEVKTDTETIIGTTALPTTAQTLTGAIAEIYSEDHPANVSVTADGTSTYKQLLESLYALVDFTYVRSGTKLMIESGATLYHRYLLRSTAALLEFGGPISISSGGFSSDDYTVAATSSYWAYYNGASHDNSGNTAASGTKLTIIY